MVSKPKDEGYKSFSGQFWLVILFEFFERGAYYGMMSFISVYFVDSLHIPKENVGVIKGVIQPLLYFLPILSGALADRFGYRKLLMIAFSLLGGGYFLTSQAGSYGTVFAALVIMGVGAGIFKPLISGTIAKTTQKSNSTLGFGIYYWSINIGAFLFPLILVPFLKALNPRYVIIASALCTSIMLIPTIFWFKDPVKLEKAKKQDQISLLQTVANAFEIIYSPIVLIYYSMMKNRKNQIVVIVLLLFLLGFSFSKYMASPAASEKYSKIGLVQDSTLLVVRVDRNLLGKASFELSAIDTEKTELQLTIFKPQYLHEFATDLRDTLQKYTSIREAGIQQLQQWIDMSDAKIRMHWVQNPDLNRPFIIEKGEGLQYWIHLQDIHSYEAIKADLHSEMHRDPVLHGISIKNLDTLNRTAKSRPFFLLFICALLITALGIIRYSSRVETVQSEENRKSAWPMVIISVVVVLLWMIPGLNLLGRIIATVIYFSVTSLLMIDKSDPSKFVDHAKFLLMIFIYSGFWVLYFQMFDSVLWYVQAYVDASSLNAAVHRLLGFFNIESRWFFDVEHVTVINAGTIILLQLAISAIVKKTKALPTMMAGIAMGTIGMAILAINTSIWVFIAGIMIFSIGEMTAHPKFISYIGLVAPAKKKAMYMGYLFLYGVFGSSIGGIVGAKLYVQFVDNLNQPKTLWLIFSGIGVLTLIGLGLFNRFLHPQHEKDETDA